MHSCLSRCAPRPVTASFAAPQMRGLSSSCRAPRATSDKYRYRFRFFPTRPVPDWTRCRICDHRKPGERPAPGMSRSSAPGSGPTSSYPPVLHPEFDGRSPVPNPQSRRSPLPPTATDRQTPPPPPPWRRLGRGRSGQVLESVSFAERRGANVPAQLLHLPRHRLARPFGILLPPRMGHLHAQPVHSIEECFGLLHPRLQASLADQYRRLHQRARRVPHVVSRKYARGFSASVKSSDCQPWTVPITGRGQQRPRHIVCSACEQSSW